MPFKRYIHQTLVLLALPSLILAQHHERWQALHQEYLSEDHGGGAISTELVEDAYGNLFVANAAGLLKFDGEDWQYMPETGQASYLSSTTIDTNGRIWVCSLQSIGYYQTNAHGQYVYTDLTESVLLLPNGDNLGTFWKLYAHEGFIFLITSANVLRWDGTDWKLWQFDSDRRILPSWVDNQLYIHARDSGIFHLNQDDLDPIAPEIPELSSGVISIIENSEAGLLCATVKNGVFYLKNGEVEPFTLSTQIDQLTILHAFLTDDGKIVLSTLKNGTLFFNRSGEFISQAQGPAAPTYHSYESRTGTIWSAAIGAILEIPDPELIYFEDKADDICQYSGEIYYTNTSELKAIKHGPDGYRTESLQKTATTWDLQVSGTDLLFGNLDSLGIFREPNTVTKISVPRHIAYLRQSWMDPNLIYANDPPTITRWRQTETSWKPLDSLDEFKAGALSMVELPNSKILISSENKALLLADWPSPDSPQSAVTTITALGPEHGLPDSFIWTHCLRANEQVIVISNQGLYLYNPETETFQYDPALGNDLGTDAHRLESCEYGNGQGNWLLYLPSSDPNVNQIGLLSIDESMAAEWTPWMLPSVAAAGEVEALLHEHSPDTDVLWVGGNRKLLRYDLPNIPEYPTPETNITSIHGGRDHEQIHSGAQPPTKEYKWPYALNTLQIAYAAPAFPLAIKGYETRLIGFNEAWSPTTQSIYRDFTNLSQGPYTFEVRAVDEFGRRGPPASFSFTILPPWHKTAYAYFAYAVAALALLYIVSTLNSRRLRLQTKQLEAEVSRRTDELELQKEALIHANKVKQNFLASMSHEIRNPLNGIVGIAKLLSDDNQTDPKKHTERVSHLIACSNHLHQLIGQTLDYSSLEAGKLTPRVESFNPQELFTHVIQMQKNLADEYGIELVLDAPEIKRQWKGDPVLLRQILINLISNGIKYTPAGSVRLIIQYHESDFSVQTCIEVIDTGPGIPPEMQSAVFDEFTRLQGSIDSQIPGTGLGLTIAAQMAKLMGGTLTLDPEYAQGARFRLNLEFGIDWFSELDAKSATLDQGSPLSNKHILVVDDLDFNRYINSEILQSLGASVEQAKNGIEALKKLRSTHYDIAILDINMPKMSGPEAVQKFTQQQNDTTPIFIALSADDTPEMKVTCTEAGFHHFLEKPLNPISLIKLISQFEGAASIEEEDPLEYLSKNGKKSLYELQMEYKDSFKHELTQLQAALINKNLKAQKEIRHKLQGLCFLYRSHSIRELVEQISEYSNQNREIEAQISLIDQLDTLIEHELGKSGEP